MTISSDDTVWITQQLQVTEQAITAINAAIIALAGGAQSYELDTGQTRQRVTKANLGELTSGLKTLTEMRTRYRSQLGLTNTVGSQTRVTPAF